MRNGAKQTIIHGSAHEIPLPDGMIHCAATSPPYYSLRKYQGQQEVDWPEVFYKSMAMSAQPYGGPTVRIPAMRCALGLEPVPGAFIGHLVLCFREVWRVLRDDGVAWCVIGDSYAAPGNKRSGEGETRNLQREEGFHSGKSILAQRRTVADTPHLHQGDLIGIPHRLMFALQGDGWIVRNDCVYSKKSPMPESVAGTRYERCRVKVKTMQGGHGNAMAQTTNWRAGFSEDERTEWQPCPGCPKCEPHGGYVLRRGSWRHTRSHEFVLMCVKQMGYWSDQERVREVGSGDPGKPRPFSKAGNNDRNDTLRIYEPVSGRNPRSVLTPKPESYGRSHFAVYPSTLIAPLIRATCPTRCCPVCGAGWAPVVEREVSQVIQKTYAGAAHTGAHRGTNERPGGYVDGSSSILGHRPTCDHEADPVPGWLLDPFVGSGTSLAVARDLGLNAVGLDISPEYLDEHSKPRIGQTPSNAFENLPLFASQKNQGGLYPDG